MGLRNLWDEAAHLPWLIGFGVVMFLLGDCLLGIWAFHNWLVCRG